jgi:ectoine hydroxylase-related dioxygenase (phytanoyl-CoA dioxygenase family)
MKSKKEVEEYINNLRDNGFVILRNLLSSKEKTEISRYLDNLKIGPQERITSDDHPYLLKISNNKNILKIASSFFNEKAVPIQGLLFKYPTQQAIHQDTVHFSTYPRDLMLACWVAIEDVTIENGPLEYIEKSHFLPTFSHYEYPSEHTHPNVVSKDYYNQYEEEISEIIKSLKLKKVYFSCESGRLHYLASKTLTWW